MIWVEQGDGWVEVVAGEYDDGTSSDTAAIRFTPVQFDRELLKVQRDLRDFLSVLRTWAEVVSPAQADAVTNGIDRAFHISAPAGG